MMQKIVVAALLFLTAACAASAPRLAMLEAAPPTAYRLGPGDEVRINVFGLDAVTNSYVVGDAGTIALPLLPTLMANGKTVDELQLAVIEAIRSRDLVRTPSVSVQVQKYRPFFILGEVQRPGQYPYVPGMSVLAAVSVAGGYTFRANTRAVVISRAAGTTVAKGKAPPEMLVQPGDTINVLEAWF